MVSESKGYGVREQWLENLDLGEEVNLGDTLVQTPQRTQWAPGVGLYGYGAIDVPATTMDSLIMGYVDTIDRTPTYGVIQ
jgi:hypothetical protein